MLYFPGSSTYYSSLLLKLLCPWSYINKYSSAVKVDIQTKVHGHDVIKINCTWSLFLMKSSYVSFKEGKIFSIVFFINNAQSSVLLYF